MNEGMEILSVAAFYRDDTVEGIGVEIHLQASQGLYVCDALHRGMHVYDALVDGVEKVKFGDKGVAQAIRTVVEHARKC